MFRIAMAVLLSALAGTAAADHPPQRSYPMTREMVQRQIEFWNDRADLARLYDLAVTFEGGWRFNDHRAIGRLDERALRWFDDSIAEANRELSRDLRVEGRPDRDGRYRYGWRARDQRIQPVGGGGEVDVSRREIDELTRLRYQYGRFRGHSDPQSLEVKWTVLNRLIQMEQEEVERDERWLRSQGWQDPLGRRF